MKTLNDFSFKDKKVIVRCDFNVPRSKEGAVLDLFRIEQTLPTIRRLASEGAKVILMSHLGRPEEELNFELRIKKFSLEPIIKELEKMLGVDVKFLPDCIGREVEMEVGKMNSGKIALLENLRFHSAEEENKDDFSQALARLGDIYINDAFGVCHRSHASVVGITKYLPSGAGLLLEKEIKVLKNVMKNPERPLISIIGGKKVETKVGLINNFSSMGEWVLVSGLIAKEIKTKNIQFKNQDKIISPIDEIFEGKDIGPETVRIFKEKIKPAKTIIWSGPLGMIEDKRFAHGTEELARAIIASSAFTIAGGGETAEFINQLGISSKFGHLSTGGGAMLAFLGGERMPGIEALR